MKKTEPEAKVPKSSVRRYDREEELIKKLTKKFAEMKMEDDRKSKRMKKKKKNRKKKKKKIEKIFKNMFNEFLAKEKLLDLDDSSSSSSCSSGSMF
jgi:glutamyl-tRNA reductase